MRLSVRLFQLLGAETHVSVKAGAFWAKAKNALRTCKIYGALEVHKPKSACALKLSIGLVNQLPNYPDKKSSSIHA